MVDMPDISGRISNDLYQSLKIALRQEDLSYERISELCAQFRREWRPNCDCQLVDSMDVIDAYAAALIERESARAEDLENSTCNQEHLECRIREDDAANQAAYLHAILSGRAAEGDL